MIAISDLQRAGLLGCSAAVGALCGSLCHELFVPATPEAAWQSLYSAAVWNAFMSAGIIGALITAETWSLKRAWPTMKRLSIGILTGFLAGGATGAFVQLFYPMTVVLFEEQVFGQNSSFLAEQVVRIFAWGILGVLIAEMAKNFLVNLPWWRAYLGGVLGGLLGGLTFSVVSTALIVAGGENSDLGMISLICRVIGVPFVGFGIGIMIAAADILLREAWLEIRYSAREVRRVSLGKNPVVLGSDAQRCTVVVAGAPAVAGSYGLDQGKVTFEDAVSGRREFVQTGDQRAIGRVQVVVCGAGVSATSAMSAAPPPPANRFSLTVGVRRFQLSAGTQLLAADLPGCTPRGNGQIVAEVVPNPQQPDVLGLKNLTRSPWSARLASGEVRTIESEKTIRLAPGTRLNFGPSQGAIEST